MRKKRAAEYLLGAFRAKFVSVSYADDDDNDMLAHHAERDYSDEMLRRSSIDYSAMALSFVPPANVIE